MQYWQPLPIPRDDPQARLDAIRLNSLGSLFLFAFAVLRKDRLRKFHIEMCESLETEDLHLVFEIPMSHFKTTIGVEALSMWWALPFTERDEIQMRALGYDDEWIRWMKVAHDQNTRTLITHETDARVIEMGKAINENYAHNDLFRELWPQIIPDSHCTWNDHTKFHKRDRKRSADHTTATYVLRSVGQALQGIHVAGIVNDDSVGRAAQDNLLRGDGTIMEGTYRWWKQTTTRFDAATFTKTGIGRQLVIGNRWGHNDLNTRIKANHPEFKFETHDAEGGCCAHHPANTPIFPEEFSMERLAHEHRTLGEYDYLHFFRNFGVLPDECIFKPDWKRFYKCKESRPDLDLEDLRNYLLLEHNVYDGEVTEDIAAGILEKRMIVNPMDAKKKRREKHVILVVGYYPEHDRIYLLAAWAEKVLYSELMEEIFRLASPKRYNLREFSLVGDLDTIKFHLDERNRREITRTLYANELPCDYAETARATRIEVLQPIFKNHQFWCHPSQKEFLDEYDDYPAGAIDVLDTLGYVPQTLEGVRRRDILEWVAAQNDGFKNRNAGASGY